MTFHPFDSFAGAAVAGEAKTDNVEPSNIAAINKASEFRLKQGWIWEVWFERVFERPSSEKMQRKRAT